ncbi:YeeE/YedE family protein [Vibrio makurazakiensis]|uniref:YeeE/YedE family protein n=1 Tax=Vibrio makurazakiensis TaxID=2910250 RepID=UPI003D12C20D
MDHLIPWNSLFGGMLLGISASLLLLFAGKIAGISGIVGGLLSPVKYDIAWRVLFIIGMTLAYIIVEPMGFELPVVESSNIILVAIAGLLVGFGTRLGNGCTSGHGIVGMGRFSKRSIVATVTFMFVAIVVVYLKRHLGVI